MKRPDTFRSAIRLLLLTTLIIPVSACDLFDGLVSSMETNEQLYYFNWGINPTQDENAYEQPEVSNPANPKYDTTITVTVWTSEPLDLIGDDPDLTVTAILTSWGDLREEISLTLTRVEFTWPEGVATDHLAGQPTYEYKYSCTYSRTCPECSGDLGQTQPAYWSLKARRSTPDDVLIRGKYTIEIIPYLGPIVN